MRLEIRPSVEDTLAKLPEDEQAAAIAVFDEIPAAFGRSHVHSGLGIRQLRPGIYEVRLGLRLRAVFTRDGAMLKIQCIGNHDAIRRYLKERA